MGGNEHGGEALCIFKSGDKTIVGGHGVIFENFIKNKALTGVLPESEEFADFFHPNYESATLQILRFDQCFQKLNTEVYERKFSFLFLPKVANFYIQNSQI